MKTKMNEYEKQALDFATRNGVTMEILKRRDGIMWNDNKTRDIYTIQLSRNGEVYTFDFGASIHSRELRLSCNNYRDQIPEAWQPRLYDVLAAIQKDEPGYDFLNFCDNYGYEPSRESQKVYKAVYNEYENVQRLFPESEVMDELREIQ